MAAELEWLDMKAGVSLEMILPKPGQLGKMSRGWNEDLERKCSGLTPVVFWLFVCSFVFSLKIKRREKNRGDDVHFHLAGG